MTTHVEKAGGFGGFTPSSPTDGGTSQTPFTGMETTFETIATAEAVGHEVLTTMRW